MELNVFQVCCLDEDSKVLYWISELNINSLSMHSCLNNSVMLYFIDICLLITGEEIKYMKVQE